MQNKIHSINDYILILDNYKSKKEILLNTQVEEEVIGFVFYKTGNVLIDIKTDNNQYSSQKKGGTIASFYCDTNAVIHHTVSSKVPLQKVTFFLTPRKIRSLLEQEDGLFYEKYFDSLINPTDNYSNGKQLLITPNIQNAIDKIFASQYTGIAQKLFLESQIIELLSAYLYSAKIKELHAKPKHDIEKLHHAKELLINQIDTPPSLDELAKLTGLNNFKIKTGFKELFGVPVYKYLQNKRLEKAFELLENKTLNVQEVANYVGYESLGSFSNAFYKKFGYRPSDINK